MSRRKRYALVGTGSRGINMFGRPLVQRFTKHCDLAALVDPNPQRMEAANGILGTRVPMYTDFGRMLREVDPDAVIVTSRDDTHARYIVGALKAGKRAISEKPLCVDGAQCRAILSAAQAARRKGGLCYVTHNARYGAAITEMKRLIAGGAIGEVKTIHFQECLDRRHGADYFRRWHRIKRNSGGLLIHKASHHFDLLNWLADSIPETLVARGALVFYGKNGPFRARRCQGCRHAKRCDFYADMWQKDINRRLYLEAEKADGYLRDACVFDKAIDIEDQASVFYSYRNGIRVTYSLSAFASYEGWDIQIEGTEGRLETREIKATGWAPGSITVHGLEKTTGEYLRLYSPRKGCREIRLKRRTGSHGGADPQIQHDFFGRPWNAPPTYRMAPLEQAVQAVLIGHAANVSIAKDSRVVKVQEFLHKG